MLHKMRIAIVLLLNVSGHYIFRRKFVQLEKKELIYEEFCVKQIACHPDKLPNFKNHYGICQDYLFVKK